MTWKWPLDTFSARMPEGPGQFGAIRKYDVHTGVDLYALPGTRVFAVEGGVVVAIERFTGPKAGSPWWLDTDALLIEGPTGVVCYGEITIEKGLNVGSSVKAGDTLGKVATVLRNDKGRPTAMLHVELYEIGVSESVWWRLEEPRPEKLLDPTPYLNEALHRTDNPAC